MALAEPTRPVRRLWVAGISLANLGMWMAFFGPLQVLLPEQVGLLAPGSKETALAWVTGAGAACSTLGTPLAGALSDRTTGAAFVYDTLHNRWLADSAPTGSYPDPSASRRSPAWVRAA